MTRKDIEEAFDTMNYLAALNLSLERMYSLEDLCCRLFKTIYKYAPAARIDEAWQELQSMELLELLEMLGDEEC